MSYSPGGNGAAQGGLMHFTTGPDQVYGLTILHV